MLKRINLSNILAGIAIISAFAVPGAIEADMYITAAALVAGTGVSAYLSMREDGRIRHKNRSHSHHANETYQ